MAPLDPEQPAIDQPLNSLPKISAEQVRKSRRTRVLLVVFILLLLAVLGGGVYLAYTYLVAPSTSANHPGAAITTPPSSIDSDALEDKPPEPVETVTATTPNLAGLFGLTIEQALENLGPDFQLTKTTAAGEGDSPGVTQIATLAYSPSAAAAASSTSSMETIYASLNESGIVMEIYYVASLDLLAYPQGSFADLIGTSEALDSVLAAAGATPANFSYVAPQEGEYSKYDNPESEQRKLQRESATFSGSTSLAAAPTSWALTFTYDYGSGKLAGDPALPKERMVYLKLV
jgi:cytoskeletal protein RodZ